MGDNDSRRNALVDSLVRRGYVVSSSVEKAMRRVPREEFLPDSFREDAYIDTPLPIGDGQTISAPHMVAIMAERLDLAPGLKVLEIGAGSGYHAAVCAEIVAPDGHIYTMERISSLAEFAEGNLRKTGYSELVTVIFGDGTRGLPEKAPFDRIFVAAGAPDIPEPLTKQLADGGALLVPVGGRYYQDLIKVRRRGNRFEKENLGGCVFVPLIGEYGYH
ncbi:MAG: protein-L-isoaspartate(D-aspartate) O-methyltransferase [Thermoplasmata archaeon]|jgi:protein-L-isoaspartate(D-aspartate) O-methyltransferase|nr:protein-L-isoaspartate(D-aspartate) O-methyltransferase [Thermoplasmata archaeon]